MKLNKLVLRAAGAIALMGLAAGLLPATSHADNPIVQTYYTGDPASMVTSDGVFYAYTGHDEDIIEKAPGQTYNFFTMRDWRAYSTTDMVNWVDHGTVLKLSDFKWADQVDARAWAAQVCERDGKFYYYICAVMSSEYKKEAGINGYFGIGVAVADNPNGPFTDPLGKPLIAAGSSDIDPTVYIDDDGQAYLYYSQNPLKYVLLNEDMISYKSNPGIVSHQAADWGLTGYIEGPWFYARKNDAGEKIYYMVYAGGSGTEDIRYATSDSPIGPWNYRGVIMNPGSLSAVEDGQTHSSFTIHPGITEYKGHSYYIYHNAALANGQGYHRSTAIEEFTYEADGSIPLMDMTLNGRNAIDTLNPYNKVEAETICWEYGVKTEDAINSEGTIDVDVYNMHNDDYIKLESVDFGSTGAETFTAAVKDVKSDANASIELYVKENDSVSGMNSLNVSASEKIGTLKLDNTSSEWIELTTKLDKAVTGVHDLYLVFKGDYTKPESENDPAAVISETDTGMFKFDYWKFSEPAIATPAPLYTTAPVIKANATAAPVVAPTVVPSATIQSPSNNAVSVKQTVAKAAIKSIKNLKGKKAKLVIKKINGATGYEVTYALNSKLTNKKVVKKIKSTSVTLKKLRKGKCYYIKVRAFITDTDGKKIYGSYSAVRKIKIKK